MLNRIISRLRMASPGNGLSSPFGAIMAVVTVLAESAVTAEAHGGRHGSPHLAATGGSRLAGGQRHGNDAYTKAASEEQDKLLNSRLKDICRGC